MKTTVVPVITEEAPGLLKGAQLRLLQPEERERFDQLMGEQHYLGNAQLVGEQVRYVAEYQGQWIGLVAWSAGAYGLKLREEWMGWNRSQKKRRLSLVANNSRFLILEGSHSRAQSGQPADEAVLATAQPGLDRSLWARGFGGGEFRGSAAVPGHLLQG
jgi:hypothetical protein